MSIESARQQKSTLITEGRYHNGYCLPLSLDSIMRHASLPTEYYDYFYSNFVNDVGYNEGISRLLTDYFDVEVSPCTDVASIAKYNAYGASTQTYVPRVMEVGEDDSDAILLNRGVTEKQLKLRNTLWAAAAGGCNVLFSVPTSSGTEHVEGLEMIDPGEDFMEARYIVRSNVEIKDDRIYAAGDLAGIGRVLLGSSQQGRYSEFPEVSRSAFGAGNSSWELIILPPKPA